MTSAREISFAFSPDSDDAFMAESLTSGALTDEQIVWRFHRAEIHELNLMARQARYDVTALSAAAFPSVAHDYVVLPVGASMGDGYGPALVTREDSPIKSFADMKDARVAVPGGTTTASAAFDALRSKMFGYGVCAKLPLPFLEIADAVAARRADVGVLIHELQMRDTVLASDGTRLRRVDNLGRLWNEAFHAPLPLGIVAARRALGRDLLSRLTRLFRASIERGLAARARTLDIATREAMAPVHGEEADRYIAMYVNERTLEMGDSGRASLKLLFETCRALDPALSSPEDAWFLRIDP
jgi:1,4-dihydroxy-6-naphthoate synthase